MADSYKADGPRDLPKGVSLFDAGWVAERRLLSPRNEKRAPVVRPHPRTGEDCRWEIDSGLGRTLVLVWKEED